MRARTQELRRLITEMDCVGSGTLNVRTKVCGRKNCKCATDPEQRHGPCYVWSRRKDGRLLHSIVTADQAQFLQRAIANYLQIQ